MHGSRIEQRADDGERTFDVDVPPSSDERLARLGSRETEEQLHRRRLAGPVRPDEPVTLPGRTAIERSSTAMVLPYRFVSAYVSIVASMVATVGARSAGRVAHEWCLAPHRRAGLDARPHPAG
jgi:hypothetical protein